MNGRGFMLTDRVSPPRVNRSYVPIPMVYRYLMILNYLGCEADSARYELSVPQSSRGHVRRLLDGLEVNSGSMTVLIIPGASFGSSKCWRPEYFARVADHLVEMYGCSIVIAPGPGEENIALEVERHMKYRPLNLAQEVVPLDVLMGLVEKASLVITNDTGPRHFAVAFDKPVVVLMGPTDPRYTNVNLEKTRILREEVECSPCHLKVCPTDHRCMDGITPERVLQACEEAISDFVKPPPAC
jgi:heptosyltransferase-2